MEKIFNVCWSHQRLSKTASLVDNFMLRVFATLWVSTPVAEGVERVRAAFLAFQPLCNFLLGTGQTPGLRGQSSSTPTIRLLRPCRGEFENFTCRGEQSSTRTRFWGLPFTRPIRSSHHSSPAVRHEKTLGLIAAKKTGGDAALGDATGLARDSAREWKAQDGV